VSGLKASVCTRQPLPPAGRGFNSHPPDATSERYDGLLSMLKNR